MFRHNWGKHAQRLRRLYLIIETNIYESLEELVQNVKMALVGDIVLVSEGMLPELVPYVVAHRTGDELIVVRKNIIAKLMPMRTNEFDLVKWLNVDFRDRILKNLPEDLRDRIGEVKLLSIGEVYGKEPESEQFEWFKDPINRIAIKEGREYSDWYWLRDKVSDTDFASVDVSGNEACHSAGSPWVGVRPVFSIRTTADL